MQTTRPRTGPVRRRALRMARARSAKAETRPPPRSRVRSLPPGPARPVHPPRLRRVRARGRGRGLKSRHSRTPTPRQHGRGPLPTRLLYAFSAAYCALWPLRHIRQLELILPGSEQTSRVGRGGKGGSEGDGCLWRPEPSATPAPCRPPHGAAPGRSPTVRRSETALVPRRVSNWAGRGSPRGA